MSSVNGITIHALGSNGTGSNLVTYEGEIRPASPAFPLAVAGAEE